MDSAEKPTASSRPTTRANVIRLLLDRWHELNDPHRSGNGGEPGLALMPHEPHCEVLRTRPPRCSCYRASVAELERLLRAMRGSGDDDVRLAGRQLVERYVRCEHRIRVVSRPALDKHGHTRRVKGKLVTEQVREVVTVYDARLDPDVLDAGIAWLAGNWRPPEPRLPREWR